MGGLGLLGDVMHSTISQVDNGAYGKMRIASTFLGPSFGTTGVCGCRRWHHGHQ